jgi:hypothetical protein
LKRLFAVGVLLLFIATFAQAAQPVGASSHRPRPPPPPPPPPPPGSPNLRAVAAEVESTYSSSTHLLGYADVGGCGLQPNAYDLIDENFLGGVALAPYSPSMSQAIVSKDNQLLASVGYQHNDRREVMFGNSIPFPPDVGDLATVSGNPPACPTDTSFWIVTELPSTPVNSYTDSMDHIVPALLQLFKEGKVSSAHNLFNTALGWWTGTGFKSPEAKEEGLFHTRDIAYFLFAQRATRFAVNSATLSQMQSQLWSLQLKGLGGGVATAYQFNGHPLSGGTHTSNEINSLVLLAYDPRIQSTWWP